LLACAFTGSLFVDTLLPAGFCLFSKLLKLTFPGRPTEPSDEMMLSWSGEGAGETTGAWLASA